MALVSTIEETSFGLPAPAAYTIITDLQVIRSPFYTPPSTEGGEPTLVSSHTIKFRTESYASEQARDSGASPVAGHGYTIPFDAAVTTNILAYVYGWLKENVHIFADAVDA